MKKLYVLMAAVCAMCALAAVSAASSFAATSQVLCDGLTVTAATATECLATATGTNFLLEESLTKLDIVCATTSADLLPEAGGVNLLVQEVVFTNCKSNIGTTCTITAGHLPWLSVISLSAGNFFGTIQSDGAGVPEYKATCLGITVTCTAALAVGGAEDYTVDLSTLEGGIDITFLATEAGKCGAESSGTLEGLFEVLGVLTPALSEA